MIDVLLLVALPASGKSEVRKFLDFLGADVLARDFGLRDQVQFDDYPYVEFMRWVDGITINRLHLGPLFYQGAETPFADAHDWGTLVELVNDDVLGQHTRPEDPADIARWLFRRFDEAAVRAGARIKLGRLPVDVQEAIVTELVKTHMTPGMSEAKKLLRPRTGTPPHPLGEGTTILEFARGGPYGAPLPLDPPRGYRYAFSRLAPQILERATVLYIKVTPEESRRKNLERALPPPGVDDSSMFHGVPTCVMLADYGCDDLEALVAEDGGKSVRIGAHGRTYHLPAAVFDNTADLTSFIRKEKSSGAWSEADKKALRDGLDAAFGNLPR